MRQRRISSCLNCYKRKVKCDKKKPICTACEKNRIPSDLCVYKETPIALQVLSERRMQEEILSLRKEVELLKTEKSEAHEVFDLSGYGGTKKGVESTKFHGASSPSAIFYRSFGGLTLVSQIMQVFRDSYYEYAPAKEYRLSIDTSIRSCVDSIPHLVPSFNEMSLALTEYLHNPNTLSSCIDGTKLFQYFNSVFYKPEVNGRGNVQVKEGVSLVKICLILCIILEVSIIKNDQRYNSSQELFAITRYLLSNADLGSNFPTLFGFVFLYQLGKYDFDNDLSTNYRRTDLLPSIIRLATGMGIHNDIEEQFKDETANFRKSLSNIWSFIVLEDSINSLQKGIPTLIHDGYLDHRLIFNDDTDAHDMTMLFREISINVNSKHLSGRVDLNKYIKQLEAFKSREASSKSEICHRNKLSILCFIQTLSHIRFLAAPNTLTKNMAAKDTLSLYNHVKGLAHEIQNTTSMAFSCSSDFHDVKIALFRCLYFFVMLYSDEVSPLVVTGVEEDVGDNAGEDIEDTLAFITDKEQLIEFLNTDLLKSVDEVGKYNMRAVVLKSFLIELIDSLSSNDVSGFVDTAPSHPSSYEGLIDMEELEAIFFS